MGASVEISGDPTKIKEADALVLPGVGAFEPAIIKLLPMTPLIFAETDKGKPMLGICLGLQLLFSASHEGGFFKGLDVIKGEVKKFPDMGLKIPQIGWNSINILDKNHPLYQNIPDGSYVYFVHSFYGDCENKENVLTLTNYGMNFASSVGNKNIFATQFHPEKSGEVGLNILRNFISYAKK